ncbi:membrane protein insertion efficiency factor YidD [Rhodoligotrophos appendicifer]|uniref:membrane protein insertion efficiency factor YidD n=1 Tax=Rhodoligotrophos appendicifer TaxID=987056 RepID=UPI0011855BC9|nr:membrane protein insertion efficiency factor YidD [Rhodoligotrophos appendicifer]
MSPDRFAALIGIGLVQVYRYSLSSVLGRTCRHLPTCSEYATEAFSRHGGWRGFWLTSSRLCRCHPWGSHGHDPVPLCLEPQGIFFWRYGRWRGDHISHRFSD